MISIPAGDKGDPGPVGIPSLRPPMLNLQFKGDKGSQSSAGLDGFSGPRGAGAGIGQEKCPRKVLEPNSNPFLRKGPALQNSPECQRGC